MLGRFSSIPVLLSLVSSLSLAGCIFPSDFGNVPAPDVLEVDAPQDTQQEVVPDVTAPCADCPSGTLCCHDLCVDTTGRLNCGACDVVCVQDQEYCDGTRCVKFCPAGQVDCAGACVSLATDMENCGACGETCSSPRVCRAGVCELDCANGLSPCGDNCVDLTVDGNCGACGIDCEAGADCVNGVCLCPTLTVPEVCSELEACCPGLGCRVLETASDSCGTCGTTCDSGERCEANQCVCEGDLVVCLLGETCCNEQCVPEATSCNCNRTTPCGTGLECCDLECFDFASDENNCGGCGVVCDTNQTCLGGHCLCVPGTLDCDPAPGCETPRDKANCSFCGDACEGSEACDGVEGCLCGGRTCAPGQSCCGEDCASLLTDPSNCGACGKVCADGESCSGGQCKCGTGDTCATGMQCCNGVCAYLKSDQQNCGACGNPCPVMETCCLGVCGAAASCICSDACVTGQTCCGGACYSSTCPTPCVSGKQCCFNTATCTASCETSCLSGT